MLWLLVTWAQVPSRRMTHPHVCGTEPCIRWYRCLSSEFPESWGCLKLTVQAAGVGRSSPAAWPQLCGSADTSGEPGWARTAMDASWRGLHPALGQRPVPNPPCHPFLPSAWCAWADQATASERCGTAVLLSGVEARSCWAALPCLC